MRALSNSILWKQMHTYYDEMGLDIWEDEVVPSQITSNTYLANIYAHLIVSQINDYHMSLFTKKQKAPAESFYIVEIGAGHGKFSFYMLKALTDILTIYNLDLNAICYVMTDISEKNINYWRAHPAFQEFIKNGTLDFALYNALNDKTINLEVSKLKIQKQQLQKPLFIICNYIFDTLPHDAFQIKEGKLYESELVVNAKTKEQIETIFENNEYVFEHNAVPAAYYKKSPHLNAVLKQYMKHFEEASFLLPVGAVQATEQFIQFTQSATMVLVADKGSRALSLFEGLDLPDISYHGSVSLMVNFDALERYTQLCEGISLLMTDKSSDFQVANFVYNADYPISHTQHAFKMSLSTFSPQDLFNLFYKEDEPNKGLNSLDEILAVMNLSDWDPTLFYHYYPELLVHIEKIELTIAHVICIKHGLTKVWSRFFKLEKTQDIPYAIASVLYSIEAFEEALDFYQHSLKQFGEREETFYNMAIAYQALEDIPNTLKYTKRSLASNSKYKEAKDLMKELSLCESLCD